MMRTIGLLLLLVGCSGGNDEHDDHDDDHDDEDLVAGSTSIVVLLNPVPNDGNATPVPGSLGDEQAGVSVTATPGLGATTDEDGIAVIDASPGVVELALDDAGFEVEVEAEGDVVDVAVAWDGSVAEVFDGTPVRYAAGERSGAEFVDPGTELSDVEALLEEDDLVVVLRPGTYEGDLTIRGSNVVLFGEGFSSDAIVIDGSVDVRGGGVRIRGVTITGGLTSNGNNFGTSFTTVLGPVSVTGNAGTFLANTFCAGAVVPSDNATLLGNQGVAPLEPAPAGDCEDR